ncbi:exported hypothetical protein [Xanthomonas citri pv. fuscans]|nr:exported hypothetical protein [Xanthomonas citri pv. fuscans]SOO02177.1 exported hypothetical protein [Xanthomonas citri pv. fuscans]SOO06807.1 exported hypothetical protein [Xanthomonas citri pv. fuscans]SOO11072.1 exported hypothetical protein [Xanthomonas citri pv. fuscans]SOO16361.1 exported hypothetical protein [Xanthomonas citri pv. fuscans]
MLSHIWSIAALAGASPGHVSAAPKICASRSRTPFGELTGIHIQILRDSSFIIRNNVAKSDLGWRFNAGRDQRPAQFPDRSNSPYTQ